MRRSLLPLSLLLCLAPASLAQSPADRAPADSLAFLSFKGTARLGPAYQQSHLKAVLDSAKLPEFLDEIVQSSPAVKKDPAAAARVSSATALAQILARQGFSAYLLAPQGIRPPELVLSCDAGPDADALEKCVRSLLADNAAQFPLVRAGSILTLSFGDAPAPAVNADSTLAASSSFRSALQKVDSDPAVLLYVDCQHIFSLVDASIAQTPAQASWPAMRKVMGLDGIKRALYTANFNGPDWVSQSFLEAPAPRTGWITLARGQVLPKELLPRIPADAPYVSVGHFDAAGWVASFRQLAVAAGPEAQQRFDQVLGVLQMYVGRNLLTDVLAPLGADWAIYTTAVAPNAPTAIVFVNKLHDDAKARDGLTSLTYALANTSQNPRVRALGYAATAAQTQVASLSVTSLRFSTPRTANASVAWVIKDGLLYIGLGATADSVAAAANFAGPALDASTRLADAQKLLGTPAPTSFELATLHPEQYQAGYAIAGTMLPHLAAAGLKVHTNPLPAPEVVAANLGPVARVSWADADGLHSKSTSPFPGAYLLTPGGMSVGGAALVTSIALPSLNRARETANRVKCASNEKQIAVAVYEYAQQHNGQFPPNIATLVSSTSLPTECFACPDTDTSIGSRAVLAKQMNPADIPAFVQAHSDFVYLGNGLTTSCDPGALLIYEPIAHHTDGANLCFGDGHIDFVIAQNASRIIAAKHDLPAATGPQR